MTRIAAVLVTHQSERWLEATMRSVHEQARQPDVVVVVDDHSTDGTRDIVAAAGWGDRLRWLPSSSQADDRSTRIAANFRRGLQAAVDCDVAVLGDHDDLWHHNRIGHQAGILEVRTDLSMIASDGRLVDADGAPVGGTLRSAFPVPVDFPSVGPADRMRAALRYSVATGGASAVRPSAFTAAAVPDGWLHDRWWSLVATARESLMVDDEIVIDYRVSAQQEVGLERDRQARQGLGRLVQGAGELPRTVRRLRDLRSLARVATPATAPELTGARLVRNLR